MKQKENEDRADYLIRVLDRFMHTTCAGSEHLEYDEADCDGLCLCDDIENEIIFIKQHRDELLAALKLAEQYLAERITGTGGRGEKLILPVIRKAIAKADA